MRSVSVIGIGETRFGRFPDRSLGDLIREAGGKALADAAIDKKRIQALYMSNFNAQFFCGQGHLGPLAAEELGLGAIPTLRVEGACASGSLAFRQALIAVSSGLYDLVLVGGVEKMAHQSTATITTGIASASAVSQEAEVGATFPALFAMIANRYFHEYGNIRYEMALCAVQNHENARLNPDAHLQKAISMEQVIQGQPVADPLTIYDCSLVSDGAVFVVVAATDLTKATCQKRRVEVIGSGQAGDALSLAAKGSLTSFAATQRAAGEAYAMAGVKPADISFAEVHDCFTITQLINIEDLGFFAKGRAATAIAAGKTALRGEIPINPSGGLKAKGHPIGATGLSQIFEVVTQLRGDGGDRQLEKIELGLTQNLGGTAATCVVHIFRGR
jgi:acetyl-CoA C-acetyltransferase